ncbi:hypothetical protein SAMN05216464_101684 [Mucilaginibacter pineti]|uniref:Dolichyl-phosphate-mannose-protein mannosyltransferase n=1 Tax=Mucilaginibacter pineti TaxID=1391627 RepID=A0A1G6UN56_9SPHI|nr:hypothetical protein [Mucilaginibacter pineti]SDD42007.1 hypothetical protein SAMN05216464_101684 [Mucilaginibacter pineti]
MATTQATNIHQTFTSKKRFEVTFFSIVIFLLLPNLLTPLRLNTDSIRYLKIVEYLAGNLDKNSDAVHDFLPHGYPQFLLTLGKLQLLGPLTITFVNITSILLACYLLTIILEIENRLIFIGLVMISFINVKQFTLPIADQLFTLLFLAGIYLWTQAFKKQWLYMIPALAVTLLSLYVRTAGIALVIGVLLYLIYSNKYKLLNNKKLLIIPLVLIVIGFGAFIFNLHFIEKKVAYIAQLNLGLMIHQPASILGRLAIHFKELGEILINIPHSKLSSIVNPAIAGYLLIIAGILLCLIFYKAIIKLQLFNTLSFWVFMVYLMMIFLWPFYDARFLTPIVPVLVYSLFYYFTVMFKPRYIRYGYALMFLLLGFVSLAYSDALSVSNSFFLKHYGFDPSLTDKYRIHFNNQEKNMVNSQQYDIHNNDILFLLEKYDRKPLIIKADIHAEN